MLKYWVWLSELKGLRNRPSWRAAPFGDPESIFYADPDELMLTEGADPGQRSCWKTMISPRRTKFLPTVSGWIFSF